ncbi:MAG: hypothetical protein AAGF45_05090 [Pseudomonadota bacterium]
MHGSDVRPGGETGPALGPLRDLGGHRRADRIAVGLALLAGATLVALNLLIALVLLRPEISTLSLSSADTAKTFAEAVAEDFGAAISAGIPLAEMVGVEAYLSAVVNSAGTVDAIAVSNTQEEVLHTVPAGTDAVMSIRAAIVSSEGVAGYILAAPSRLLSEGTVAKIIAGALATAAFFAILCAVLLRLWQLERVGLAASRLGAAGGAVSRGTLAEYAQPSRRPVRAMGRAAGQLVANVARDRRRLLLLGDEVRALDTDKALREEIAATYKPLSRFRFARPYSVRPRQGQPLLWTFLTLSLFLAQAPLVASFAADRVQDAVGGYAIAGVMVAFAIGGLIGLSLAWLAGPLTGRWLTLLALITAAAAIGVTFELRNPYLFTAAQTVVGAAGVLGILRLSVVRGADTVAPFQAALVLLAATVLGPTLGALLAEAEGRRFAFLTVGGLMVLTAMAAALAPLPEPRRPRRLLRINAPAPAMAVVALAAALTLYLYVTLSAGVLQENYAGLALATVAIGGPAFIPAIAASMSNAKVSQGVRDLAIAIGCVALALAVIASATEVAGIAVTAPLYGLAFGLIVLGAGSALKSGAAPLSFVGVALGGIALALATAVGAPADAACVVFVPPVLMAAWLTLRTGR